MLTPLMGGSGVKVTPATPLPVRLLVTVPTTVAVLIPGAPAGPVGPTGPEEPGSPTGPAGPAVSWVPAGAILPSCPPPNSDSPRSTARRSTTTANTLRNSLLTFISAVSSRVRFMGWLQQVNYSRNLSQCPGKTCSSLGLFFTKTT